MTPQETGQVLALCAAYDSRTVGRADILAWHDVIGDVPFRDAAQAVKDHYRETRDRVMPADIRDRVTEIRRARVRDVQDVDLVRDIDPEDTGTWVRALQARRGAVLNGVSIDQAKAIPVPAPAKSIGGAA